MEANFWHDRWTLNELGWHELEFNVLLTNNFHRLGLAAGSRVFVPLCGKTRDIAWLLGAGYQVAGAELSELAITQLFDELGVQPVVSASGNLKCFQAPGLDIFTGDIFELGSEMLGKIDATYDRAALVALPPAMRVRYTAHLRSLTNTAPQLLICFEYDQNKMAGPPHSVPAKEVWKHYSPSYRLELAEAREVAGGLRGATPADELVWLLQPLAAS